MVIAGQAAHCLVYHKVLHTYTTLKDFLCKVTGKFMLMNEYHDKRISYKIASPQGNDSWLLSIKSYKLIKPYNRHGEGE